MRCPKCFEILVRIDQGGVPLRQCGGCFGAWLGEVPFKRLTRPQVDPADASAEAPQASLVDLAALVGESNSRKDVRCPECGVVMRKGRVHPMIPVEIDQCPKCRGVWLDAGELALIQRLYYEMRTSDDPKIVALREKVAMVNASWDERRAGAAELPQGLGQFSLLESFVRDLIS